MSRKLIAQAVVNAVLFEMEDMSPYETNILLDGRGDHSLRIEYDFLKNELIWAVEQALEREDA